MCVVEDGRVQYPAAAPREDDGDFSDFYIPPDPRLAPDQSKRLQEEQDAELARLMQDQEKKVHWTFIVVRDVYLYSE